MPKEKRLSATEKIASSDVFLAIITENYWKDASAMHHLGVAVALDKPIYVLAKVGTPIPGNLVKIGRGMEYFAGEADVAAAGLALAATIQADLALARLKKS